MEEIYEKIKQEQMEKLVAEEEKELRKILEKKGIDPDKYIEEQIERHKKRIEEVESSENFLHYDFQGWPVYKKTLRQLLEELGATEENGFIGFKSDNEILNSYPICGEDDGMAYLCNEMVFSEANVSKDKDGNKLVIFWRDIKWKNNGHLENE